MIKYQDGQLTDILPASLRYDSDIQALSYSIKMAMQKMMEYRERMMLLVNIDSLPENILDLLAIEMNCHYYDENFTIEQKRDIIRKTPGWYMQAGTVAAVLELIKTVFGDGDITEWYNFLDGAGEPGTFDARTDVSLKPEMIDEFNRVIKRIKRESAHLRNLGIWRTHKSELDFCGVMLSRTHNIFKEEKN